MVKKGGLGLGVGLRVGPEGMGFKPSPTFFNCPVGRHFIFLGIELATAVGVEAGFSEGPTLRGRRILSALGVLSVRFGLHTVRFLGHESSRRGSLTGGHRGNGEEGIASSSVSSCSPVLFLLGSLYLRTLTQIGAECKGARIGPPSFLEKSQALEKAIVRCRGQNGIVPRGHRWAPGGGSRAKVLLLRRRVVGPAHED